ncbi:HAD family hydrolase [Amycolatopsis acidicola]|uniref:HAD family hydrolase n=1 Tax=Amycolatopsis acidicola TaxID=2596893 RepID=A0A5N0UZ35_9PSEU|nr:HAD family hydrolase [Amycolatopsis acidicola]KAA9157953.1 HAD family hydrolase [Amycolatopsis acidicola]
MIAFTVDVGGVLGDYTGPRVADVLTDLAQAPANAAEIDRELLSVVPTLSSVLKATVCERLVINPADWPKQWSGGFQAYPETAAALKALAELGPVGALPNLSTLGGEARMAEVREQCGDYLSGIFPSYRLRARKPQKRCWRRAAPLLGVRVGDLIHIGDRVPEDIVGALNAGCRLAVLTNTRGVVVPDRYREDPRVRVVDDLPAAVELLTELSVTGLLGRSRRSHVAAARGGPPGR